MYLLVKCLARILGIVAVGEVASKRLGIVAVGEVASKEIG